MNRKPERIRELLAHAESHLVQHGVPNARRNAEWMLCHTLGCSMLELYVESTSQVDAERLDAYWQRIERRAGREPLQYILGSTEFMSLPFAVRPGVFVPRPDTEILVEQAERVLRGLPLHRALSVLDLCCGSGIIGVSLAQRVANATVVSIDVSADATALTSYNAHKNDVSARVRVVCADAFEFLKLPSTFTAIVCNPPYIETGELAGLPREVREHEPMLALDGGRDGLDFYRRVIPLLFGHLAPGGVVMFEIGDTQGAAVIALLREAGFVDGSVTPDLSGRDRVVTAYRERADG